MEITEEKVRRFGRTTRAADDAIQQLFTKGEVALLDHHNTMQATDRLVRIILRRLEFEHQVNKDHINIAWNRFTCRISLRKPPHM